MKTKPFDLKAALAGAKVVRVDGQKVANVRRSTIVNGYPLEADILWSSGPSTYTFKENGVWGCGRNGDLVMVDEPVRTKPFNLEAALKGEPVVTRDGRSVIDLKRFETVNRIYGVLGGSVTGWGPDGSMLSTAETRADLFMAVPEPKMREVWLNIYPYGVHSHDTEKDAEIRSDSTRIGKARRILIPEEEEA